MRYKQVEDGFVPVDCDKPGDYVDKFLKSDIDLGKIDLTKVNYPEVTNFVNGVRMYIRHHKLPVKMSKVGDALFLKRIGS